MSDFYRRQELASELAGRLLNPGLLDEGLRSGLFLVGMRRTGKTTFLRNDLIPALKARGAVVVYVDLWSDTQASPSMLLHKAVRQSIADLSNPLRRRHQDNKPEEGPTTLADNLTMLVDHSRADVVLIVDEIIQAIQSDEGHHTLLAMLNDLTSQQDQAFAGATVLPYPRLDRDYVRHVLERLGAEGMTALPSEEGAWAAFQALECRPEEFLRVLRQWHDSRLDLEPDHQLQAIVSSQRSATADLTLRKVEQTGELARAIFDWIAARGGAAQGLFTKSATGAISAAIGRPVPVEELHLVVHEMIGANLIIRQGHGDYVITDPVALEIWQKRQDEAGQSSVAGPGSGPPPGRHR